MVFFVHLSIVLCRQPTGSSKHSMATNSVCMCFSVRVKVCVFVCVYFYAVRSRTCDAPFIITNDCGFFFSSSAALFLHYFYLYSVSCIAAGLLRIQPKQFIFERKKKQIEREGISERARERIYRVWIEKLGKSP